MPSSDHTAISAIIELVMQADPKSILDIGIGFGKYGMLCREYTDIWQRRYWRDDWQVTIDGIEPYGRYISEVQRSVYDHLHIGAVPEVLKYLGHYDLVLFIDVLEHLDRAAGEEVLAWISQHSDRAIVTTPVQMSQQGAVFGNEHERHVTQWTMAELIEYGPVLQLGNVYILQLTKETSCKSP